MGMSASQARLLSITARISDTELRAQSASNTKIRLSMESEEVSKKYLDALNSKVLKINSYNDASGKMVNLELNYTNLMATGNLRLTDKEGNIIDGTKATSSDKIHYMLISGQWALQKIKSWKTEQQAGKMIAGNQAITE